MKVALARPTYGPIEPFAEVRLLSAIMHAASNGVQWIGTLAPNRVAYAAARNSCAKAVLGTDAEAVVWVDDDIVLPNEAIARLVSYAARPNDPLDFVSGVYFQRIAPHFPLFGKFDGDSFVWASQWEENALGQVDGVGFGFCLTTVDLLRRIMALQEVKESKEQGPFEYSKFSEDLTFCLRAGKVGSRPWVDTGILCGHLGEPAIATFESFARHRDGAARFKRVEGVVS